MTALGLVVAVPAVLAYNWLQRRNKSIAEDLSAFSNDVLGYPRLERRGASGRGRRRPRRQAGAVRPSRGDDDRRPDRWRPDPRVIAMTAGPPRWRPRTASPRHRAGGDE